MWFDIKVEDCLVTTLVKIFNPFGCSEGNMMQPFPAKENILGVC
jgi:hypothetical protein